MRDQYGVIGNPIAHSRSPEIHLAFARQFELSLDFIRLLATAEDFDRVIANFIEGRGKGLSVTMPFKQRAYEIADTLSQRARIAAAVNTLKIDERGAIFGDNTDGPGLVTDILSNLGWQIRDRTILLLGAGGAARGILQSLCEQAPASLLVANRTEAKASSLASHYADMVSASSISDLKESFDLIINATGASLQGSALDIPECVVSAHTCCYDLAYAADETPFNRWARLRGAADRTDGLGMLVEQAAVAFQLWHGHRPKTRPVIAEIRHLMTNGQ